MNLRQIELFRAVMIHGGASRASEAMRIAQPAVSRAIAALEEELGFALFTRERRRLVPTAEAEAFFREVERTFVGLDHLRVAARSIRTVGSGQLRVGCMTALSQGFLADVLARFAAAYPDVTVSVQVRSSARLWEWTADGRCDLAVVSPMSSFNGVATERFMALPMVLALPGGHRLAHRAVIGPGDLAGEPFLSLGSTDPTRLEIDRIFADAGVERRMRFETQYAATLCRMVVAGLGVALVNPLAVPDFAHAGVVARPFRPIARMVSELILPTRRAPDRIAAAFIGLLRQKRDEVCRDMDVEAQALVAAQSPAAVARTTVREPAAAARAAP